LFLVDTNVISEIRKGSRADTGAIGFLRDPANELFLPVQVVGELRRGVQNVTRKGDVVQAKILETWFQKILEQFSRRILVFDLDCAQTWGRLAGSNEQNLIDKQIAAIAIVYDLTLATRNTSHFSGAGVRLLNPFTGLSTAGPPTQ
jgi:predicted nucleic acid-binding protein